MRHNRDTMTPAWLALVLILMAGTPPANARPGWDKCPQSATITLDRHSRTKRSGIRRSTLRRLLPAVLVTGQTYDFIAVCPAEPMRRMAAASTQVHFYQEAPSADGQKGQIVLLPFGAPQRTVIVGTTMTGRTGRSVPVSFSEQALEGTHEQKIVAAVSVNGERALVTFVLISASYYRREIQTLPGRRE